VSLSRDSGFLRKVYGILSAQLLLTTIVATLFILVEPLEHFLRSKYVFVDYFLSFNNFHNFLITECTVCFCL